MKEIAKDRVNLFRNPPHPGERVQKNMGETSWSVTEKTALLGCEHENLSRLLNGKAGVRGLGKCI
ncbi:MAG: hypothetical protein OXF74_13505 [Rhodobacteraceae bacterium]|nr:hypothetical protein [Paracoccaceae bacterium]